MAKRTDIKKVLIIGSGPIVIGQAAEFDYAGTQACLALKEEGYEVILCNSNPATIMTDTAIADKVYMEPLTLEYIAKILRYERPDAIVPGIGGQTGLNLAMQLEKKGILKECGVELLGTSSESIERAEDRELFKEMCESIGEPVIPSEITYDLEEAKAAAERIGYPVVLRPAFTLGGTGGGFADITVMPRLVNDAGYIGGAVGIAQDKAVIGAVFHQPFLRSRAFLPLVKICIEIINNIHGQTELMLGRARLHDNALRLLCRLLIYGVGIVNGLAARLLIGYLACLLVEKLTLEGIGTVSARDVGLEARVDHGEDHRVQLVDMVNAKLHPCSRRYRVYLRHGN